MNPTVDTPAHRELMLKWCADGRHYCYIKYTVTHPEPHTWYECICGRASERIITMVRE